MKGQLGTAYSSRSQRARVITEAWGEHNLYCPNCSSPSSDRLEHNTKANDYCCPSCRSWFQLKSQCSPFRDRVCDGAFAAMIQAIRKNETPNFYFMQYEPEKWSVRNLLLVPSFAFPESAILKRNPLSPAARRAGWVGCNIALNRIPADARIQVISDFRVTAPSDVRRQFLRIKPLESIPIRIRGWTLDVLNAVRALKKSEFTTDEAYSLVPHLEFLHPGNRHVREKLRQQLQVLRDSKLLVHIERGRWRLTYSIG